GGGARRGGAERGLGARRYRRPVVCHANHAARRSLSLRRAAKRQRRQDGAWRIRGGHRVNEIVSLHKKQQPAPEPFPAPTLPEDRPRQPRRRAARLLGLGALLALFGGLAFGAWRYEVQHHEAVATAERRANFVPDVRVGTVRASCSTMVVSLPGSTSAFTEANIFARASGYIDKRNVDIGDHVKQGQLLALITAPELDHQIQQAEATLSQTQATLRQNQANADLANVTWQRDRPLVEKGWVTPQQGDIDRLGLQAQQATVGVAQSNIAAQQAQI